MNVGCSLLIVTIVGILSLGLLFIGFSLRKRGKEDFGGALSAQDSGVILTFMTQNHCQEWKNLVKSLEKLNLKNRIVVYCLDEGSFRCAQQENVKAVRVSPTTNVPGEADYGTKPFKDIMMEKVRMITEELEKGVPILYLDTDIVVLQDPFPHLNKLSPKDVYFQSDEQDFRKDVTNHCAGCMFIRPTSGSKQLFGKTLSYLENVDYDDQVMLNQIIQENESSFNIGSLDPGMFPNGPRYFDAKSSVEPFLVHNNYIVGLHNKIQRFKNHNLWLLPGEKMVFLTQYYRPRWKKRMDEINKCLQLNLNNPEFDRVVLFTEEEIPLSSFDSFKNHKKIHLVNLNHRLRFKDAVTHVSEKQYKGRICVLTNSDIYFDDSLSEDVSKFDLNNAVLCLSRYDMKNDKAIRYDCNKQTCCEWSQDTWIFRAPLHITDDVELYDDLELGTPQCDHVWAFILVSSGYDVLNPCKDVKSYHLHEDEEQRNKNSMSDKEILHNNKFSYYIPSMYI